MTEIDDRIVVMKFDNASFERAMGETLKSLDKLRQSLDFSKSKKGFNDLSLAAKNMDMGHVHTAIDGINSKFLAMATIGVTALTQITSAAITAGARMIKAVSLDPILDGFQEWETNMNSIQTIMANTSSKGSTLEDVNKALDTLNEYSDKTIYNFSQMTRNIGTFTAAGIDLDTSVASIKGISNLAAISGSNAEQASTAMYQLSQALASGTLKLMDWNSVVNAGMGGEVFQKALFTTGQALGTLKSTNLGQTFEEWKDAGNSFRGSLQDGWITAEVLTNTLQGFTGDLTEAQITALGYTKEQAKEIMKMGKIGLAAATEVKTFTQLISTVKESIGSGWSQSFRTVVGDFNEAKAFFTNFNGIIGSLISRSADARNNLLAGWKFLGGRNELLKGFYTALQAIASVVKPIKEAFRAIFPKKTAVDLLNMTKGFTEFAEKLKIGGQTSEKVKNIFSGFFAALEIGFEVIKGIARLIGRVFSALAPAGGALLSFGSETGGLITSLNEALVEGGGIMQFFDKLGDAIAKPLGAVSSITEAIGKFFGLFDDGIRVSTKTSKVIEDVGTPFQRLSDIITAISDRFKSFLGFLGDIAGHIVDFFKSLGGEVADALGAGNFDKALDILNVGLLGGIIVLLRKFLKNGISIDLTGGFFDKIGGILDGLKNHLKAMQLEIKAKALLKIAAAIAILTASVLVLSMIDSAALTKALVAMTVGFGQLVGSMTALAHLTGPTTAGKFAVLGVTMVLLAASMAILTLAIKNLSSLNPGELAVGLAGIGASMLILVKSANTMKTSAAGIVRAGVAMIPLAIALIILSRAVKAFAEVSTGDLLKGLATITIFMKGLSSALDSMPERGALESGISMIAIAFAMKRLAEVIQLFAAIPMGDLAKGIISITLALGLIGSAMNAFPEKGMIRAALGLLVVTVALVLMSKAISSFGNMKLGDLATGIAAISVMLLVLAVATKAMSSSVTGALAIVIVAGALMLLLDVIKELAKIKILDLVKGLLAMAAIFVVIAAGAALMSFVMGPLLLMGVGIGLLGAGLALLGVGIMFIAKAFEIFAKSGAAGAKAFVQMLTILGEAVPKMAALAATFFISFATEIFGQLPKLIEMVGKILEALIDLVIKLTPKIAEAISGIITETFNLLREQVPAYVLLGVDILLGILQGIRDSIGEFVTVVSDIVTNFIDAFAEEIPDLIESLVNLLATAFQEIARGLGELMPGLTIGIGVAFMDGFITGMSEQLGNVLDLISGIIGDIIDFFKDLFGIKSPSTVMADIGMDIIRGLLQGLKVMLGFVRTFFIEIPLKALAWIGNVVKTLFTKGADLVVGLLRGLGQKITEVATWFRGLAGKVLGWIGNTLTTLVSKGKDIIGGFLSGIGQKVTEVATWFRGLGGKILGWLPNPIEWLKSTGVRLIQGLWNGITSMGNWLKDKIKGFAEGVINAFKAPWKLFSPSRVMAEMGENLMLGLSVGMEDQEKAPLNAANNVANNVTKTLQKAMDDIPKFVIGMDEFNPVITPVLDLTKVQKTAKGIERLMQTSALAANVSFDQARVISADLGLSAEITAQEPVPTGPSEVKFEQNIYAPEQLSTAAIYRETRSQIVLAKEELKIG